MGLVLSGYNNFAVSIALLQLNPQFQLDAWGSGLLAAATLAGMLAGSLTLGRFADLVGRRPALLINLSLVAVFAVLSAFAGSVATVALFRLLAGVGIGAGYPIGSSYVADVATTGRRGRLMTLAFSGWGVGASVAALVGWLVMTIDPGGQGWRVMFAVGAVPAVVTFVVVAFVGLPESPRWSASRRLTALPFSALGSPDWRRQTVAALLPWFLMDVSVYGVGLLTPTLLADLGMRHSADVAAGNLLLSGFTLVGFAVAYLLIDRIGRRSLQTTGFAGMAVALAVLSAIGHAPPPVVLLVLFGALQVATNAGPNTTTWIVPAELFPTRLRASGQGLATAFSRVAAILAALLLPVLAHAIGVEATLAIVAGVCVLGAVASAVLLPETAGTPLSD